MMPMPARRLDDEIDRLYQLPLDEFTAARNALAKSAGPEVKSLVKPPVAAWAVNQLYWKDRAAWDALIAAANEQRRAHKAVLGGRSADLRGAGKAHDEAVEAALKATLALLAASGQPATDATRQAVLNTLRALPADEPPGRLSRALQPGGFEMLSGMTVAAARKPASPPAPPKRETAPKETGTARSAAEARKQERQRAEAKEAIAAATRELRRAEHTAKREEFDAARATREAEKAERTAADARKAFEAAQEALQEAEAALPPAQRARDVAVRRAQQAEAALDAARTALEAAQAASRELS